MANYQPRFWREKSDQPFDYTFSGEPQHKVEPYIFSEQILIAVDVALTTARPLLVAGKPGCGKSRIANSIAALLGWNYLERTMTSRTRLEELTVEMDHLRRLHDAHRKDIKLMPPDATYRNPGVFWWAFAPQTARVRGCSASTLRNHPVNLAFPGVERPQADDAQHAVLLIDEIDKAEPDVPNDLLEPLDLRSFSLPDGSPIQAPEEQRLLTIITTNGERSLPPAFLRRCITLVIDEPSEKDLIAIANAHVPQAEDDLVSALAERTIRLREAAPAEGRRAPGTSEFLDAIRACVELGVSVDDDAGSTWSHVERAILQKTTEV